MAGNLTTESRKPNSLLTVETTANLTGWHAVAPMQADTTACKPHGREWRKQ